MAREHLVLTKLYSHDNCQTHQRKYQILMRSTYLTLSGSVRNGVGNLDLLGTTGKTTGSQPGIAFLPSVQLVGESESEVAQSCPTLCDPMDCSLSGSSVHGIFQARVLEWVAISFSRGSSRPRNRTRVSCIAGRRFTIWATREAPTYLSEIISHYYAAHWLSFAVIVYHFLSY